jgi:hypothetical protein
MSPLRPFKSWYLATKEALHDFLRTTEAIQRIEPRALADPATAGELARAVETATNRLRFAVDKLQREPAFQALGLRALLTPSQAELLDKCLTNVLLSLRAASHASEPVATAQGLAEALRDASPGLFHDFVTPQFEQDFARFHAPHCRRTRFMAGFAAAACDADDVPTDVAWARPWLTWDFSRPILDVLDERRQHVAYLLLDFNVAASCEAAFRYDPDLHAYRYRGFVVHATAATGFGYLKGTVRRTDGEPLAGRAEGGLAFRRVTTVPCGLVAVVDGAGEAVRLLEESAAGMAGCASGPVEALDDCTVTYEDREYTWNDDELVLLGPVAHIAHEAAQLDEPLTRPWAEIGAHWPVVQDAALRFLASDERHDPEAFQRVLARVEWTDPPLPPTIPAPPLSRSQPPMCAREIVAHMTFHRLPLLRGLGTDDIATALDRGRLPPLRPADDALPQDVLARTRHWRAVGLRVPAGPSRDKLAFLVAMQALGSAVRRDVQKDLGMATLRVDVVSEPDPDDGVVATLRRLWTSDPGGFRRLAYAAFCDGYGAGPALPPPSVRDFYKRQNVVAAVTWRSPDNINLLGHDPKLFRVLLWDEGQPKDRDRVRRIAAHLDAAAVVVTNGGHPKADVLDLLQHAMHCPAKLLMKAST